MIKVLHSEIDSCIGGIETFLLNLTKCIDRSNISFEFITRRDNPAFENEFKKLGCKIHKVPSDVIGYCRAVKNLFKKNDYDIIHIHKNSAADIVLPILAKKYSNARIIVHSHNTQPNKNNFIIKLIHTINRPILKSLADLCFACSNLAANWMYGGQFGKKHNAEIIKNGIILNDYSYNETVRTEIRSNLGVCDKFVIGHVGRFSPQKNHKFLIDMMKELDDNYLLMLVGDGYLYDEIKAYTEKNDISEKVLFLGERNDVNKLMQAMDVFVLPSLWEGLGIVAIEAQVSGLPVIASDNIPYETNITDNIVFFNLDRNKWCNEIKKIKKSFARKNVNDLVIKSGYDMNIIARVYEKRCKELLNIENEE